MKYVILENITRLWLFAVVFDLGCLVKVSSVKALVFDLESIFATTGTEWGMIFYCCLVIVTLHLFGGKHFPENVFIFWCLAWHKILINRLFSAIHLCPYPPPFLSATSITTIGTTVTATIITTTPSCRHHPLYCHHCNHYHLCHYCAYMISMIFCEWKITKSVWDHFKVADKNKKTNGA